MVNSFRIMLTMPMLLICLCCIDAMMLRTAPPHADDIASLQQMIDKTPAKPDLSKLVEPIMSLGRRLRLACPCIGIHGSGEALLAMSAETDSLLCYDLESGYMRCLVSQLLEMGIEPATISDNLHLGPITGDILRFDLRSLPRPIDLLVCGPPCHPWMVS